MSKIKSNKTLSIGFVDLGNARQHKQEETLRILNTKIDYRDIRIIYELYKNQKVLRMLGSRGHLNTGKASGGGCNLSPGMQIYIRGVLKTKQTVTISWRYMQQACPDKWR